MNFSNDMETGTIGKLVDKMLDFEEELKKFKPSLEVEQVEDAIEQENTVDVAELVSQLLKEQG